MTGRTVLWRFSTIIDMDEDDITQAYQTQLNDGYEEIRKNKAGLLSPDMEPYIYDEITHQTTTLLTGETITSVQIVWKVATEYFTSRQ